MANTVDRDIPQGPGSADPTFAPANAIQPVQLGARPLTSQLEQLRNALFAAGGELAQGLGAAAGFRARLDRRKEEVVDQQERELDEVRALRNEQLETELDRRLQQQQALSQDLLLDGRASNPEWLLQQSMVRFSNAPTQQERNLWFSVVQHARSVQAAAVRDAEQERIEDINLAAMTASEVVSEAAIRVAADTDLANELIGDGHNISGRVQDYVLSLVHETMPGLFDVSEGEPDSAERRRQRDTLMAKLIKATNPITDGLVNQYLKRVNGQNEVTASQKIDAAFYGALTGETGGQDMLASQLRDVRARLLPHLTPPQQEAIVGDAVQRAVQAAGDGSAERDVQSRVRGVEMILQASGLSEIDKANARESFRKSLQADIKRGAVDSVKTRILSFSRPQVDTDPSSEFFGQVRSDLPDPDAAVLLSFPDPQTGESGYVQAAREYMASIGMSLDADDPIAFAVREEVAELEGKAQRAAAADIRRDQSIMDYLSNRPGGDPTAAWETSPAFASQTPSGMDEAALARVDRMLPETQREQLRVLAGKPVANVPETRDVRTVVWGATAKEANLSPAYELPDSQLTKIVNDWTAGTPEDMWNALAFYRYTNNKHKLLQRITERGGVNAAVAMSIAHNNMFRRRASLAPTTWEAEAARAQSIVASTDVLNRDKRQDPAVDERGRRLFIDVDGRPVTLTKKGQALQLIMGAMEDSRVLADPLNLQPEQSFDNIIGVPRDLNILEKGANALIRSSAGAAIGGLLGPFAGAGAVLGPLIIPPETIAATGQNVIPPEQADPAAVEAMLANAMQGIGDLNVDHLLDVYFGLVAGGSTAEEAAVGTVGFMANAGLSVADTGNGPQIRFDPTGALGPNALNFGELSQDVEAFLDTPLPDQNFRALNSQFLSAGEGWRSKDFFAARFRDLPHLVMPHRFSDPSSPDAQPLQWRFATEDANWIPAAQAGGLPLLFLTQDNNPEWVMLQFPDTGLPVFGYSWHEIEDGPRRPDLEQDDPGKVTSPQGRHRPVEDPLAMIPSLGTDASFIRPSTTFIDRMRVLRSPSFLPERLA